MRRPKVHLALIIRSAAWRREWPFARQDIGTLLKAAAAHPGLASPAEGVVGVVLADDEGLRRLNRQFRGKDRPTNVLSFPDAAEPLGGIALACETVSREAKEQHKHFVNHAKHLILHGFLHLLGYDHVSKKEASLMEQAEIAILSDVGIPNPYLIEKSSA